MTGSSWIARRGSATPRTRCSAPPTWSSSRSSPPRSPSARALVCIGESGIVEREATIHLSNIKLVDPKSDQPVKVGFRVLEDGRKVRVARGSGNVIEG